MANNTLAALSTEKLIKRRDLFKGVIIGFGMVWLAVIGLAIYFLITKNTYKLFFPLATFPIAMLPSFIQWNLLNKEIKNRQQQ